MTNKGIYILRAVLERTLILSVLSCAGCKTSSDSATSLNTVAEKSLGVPMNSATPRNVAPVRVSASKVKPAPTMTVTQAEGLDILKALNADSAMKGHKISVGTAPGSVWLNGTVSNASQRVLAAKISKKNAPGSKILNRLTVTAKK